MSLAHSVPPAVTKCTPEETDKVGSAVILAIRDVSSSPSSEGIEVPGVAPTSVCV